MATEPLTNEAIALTEKKVDMALDEIIKMSKSNVNKGKKQRRAPNKSQNSSNGALKYNNALKARRYMDSRSDVRQGAFAKRRSNFQGNQFPVTFNAARKAANALPRYSRPINAGRIANTNLSRYVAQPVQNRATHGGYGRYTAKQQQQQQQPQPQPQKRGEEIEQKQGNGGGRQRPQTLDSLFANMKEERMRTYSQQQQQQRRINAFAVQQLPRVPWVRGRRW